MIIDEASVVGARPDVGHCWKPQALQDVDCRCAAILNGDVFRHRCVVHAFQKIACPFWIRLEALRLVVKKYQKVEVGGVK